MSIPSPTGLDIFYSNQIEVLAEDLKSRLAADRAARADPFDFLTVAVPNNNIQRWLRIRAFHDAPSLSAGIDFMRLDKRLRTLLLAALPPPAPDGGHADAVEPDLLQAIASILVAPPPDAADALAPLLRYVYGTDGLPANANRPALLANEDTSARLWQLSGTLRDLMQEYDVRRPDFMRRWLDGSPARDDRPLTPEETAEAALARALFSPDGLCGNGTRLDAGGRRICTLRQLFDLARPLSAPPGDTLYFFGLSNLSPLHAQILRWLAQHRHVVFYYITPCTEYWGDIRRAPASAWSRDDEDFAVENPLLGAWGRAGRETMRMLVDLEESSTDRLPVAFTPLAPDDTPAPDSGSILRTLQGSIRSRTSSVPAHLQDATVQVAACPSLRREVETVYNSIIGSLWSPPSATGTRPWPPCTCSDIAVLVPDMATYRPIIESVFDARGAIPYGIVDGTVSQDSALLRGLLALLALARTGLSRDPLFAVLENQCVQRALRFTADDLADWRSLTDDLGAFDAFDKADAAAHGLADAENFTWNAALRRLRRAAVDTPPSLPGRRLPADADALHFSAIVERLYRTLAPLRTAFRPCLPPDPDTATTSAASSALLPDWATTIRSLLDQFLAPAPDDTLEADVRREIFRALRPLTACDIPVPLAFVAAYLEREVGTMPSRKGEYLTSGVTVASLQPMRPVPFRQVYVLGLGEAFPGQASDSSLDLRRLARSPGAPSRLLGDASRPEINRYLFLETVMSVRDRLVLSYVAKDLKTDADLFPSPIVRDLETFLSDRVFPPLSSGQKTSFQETQVPLLERNPACCADIAWSPDDPASGLLPTYDDWARRMACDKFTAPEEPGNTPARSTPASTAPDAPPILELPLQTLARFLQCPLQTAAEKLLRIPRPVYQDNALDAEAPIALKNFSAPCFAVHAAVLETYFASPGSTEADALAAARSAYADGQGAGQLPLGILGAVDADSLFALVQRIWQALEGTGLPRTAPPSAYRVRLPISVTANGIPRRIILTGDAPTYFPAVDASLTLLAFPLKSSAVTAKDFFYPMLVRQAVAAGATVEFATSPLAFPPDGLPAPSIHLASSASSPSLKATLDLPSRADALAAFQALAASYLEYLSTPAPDGLYLDFDWKNTGKITTASPWDPATLAEALVPTDTHGHYDNAERRPVVWQDLQKLSRLPIAAELPAILARYRLVGAPPTQP